MEDCSVWMWATTLLELALVAVVVWIQWRGNPYTDIRAHSPPLVDPDMAVAIRRLEFEQYRTTSLYQTAFDQSPDAIFVLDEGRRIQFVNRAAIHLCNHLGKPTQQILEGAFLDEVPLGFLPDHFHDHVRHTLENRSPMNIQYVEPADQREYHATFAAILDDSHVSYVLARIFEVN